MEAKLAKLTPKVGGAPFTKIPTNTQDVKGKFPLRHLKKVLNSEEHCMVIRDGGKYYWCEDGIFLKTSPAECITCTSQVMSTLLGPHKRKNSKRTML
jgi:hypothetical protein